MGIYCCTPQLYIHHISASTRMCDVFLFLYIQKGVLSTSSSWSLFILYNYCYYYYCYYCRKLLPTRTKQYSNVQHCLVSYCRIIIMDNLLVCHVFLWVLDALHIGKWDLTFFLSVEIYTMTIHNFCYLTHSTIYR